MNYLFCCAKRYIIETHAGGQRTWDSVVNSIDFIFAHPNGWEGVQQEKMRSAAVAGGLIPDTHEGRARVQFVTEGEASLHFCMNSELAKDAIKVRLSLIHTPGV